MEVVYSFLLLAALTGVVSGLFTKKHIFVNQTLDWFGAQAYCRSNYVDLSTINTPDELRRFKDQTAAVANQYAWVGLNKKSSEKIFTVWSDGAIVKFVNWNLGQPDFPDTEHCGLVFNAAVYDHSCEVKTSFFCYKWQPKLIVVQEEKTWDEAQKHCRTHYRNSMSVYSKGDLEFVKNVTGGIQTNGFWTALRYYDGSWFWVNGDSLGSLISLSSCPVQPLVCGALTTGNNVLENRDCEEKKPFICYVF